ncbi:hypothetical protein AAFF_G00103550 [Aldrovandia affinis]|uniref:Uncharacterized protein n=1 Tax=Aldrovandia affinis TaxID=143900 RepID=A0AAD7WBF3_9TELE|nr:hypothetical protein AAFF_G00103550 [Aldrovandia affinis]
MEPAAVGGAEELTESRPPVGLSACTPSGMRKSRSVLAVSPGDDSIEPPGGVGGGSRDPSPSPCTLGVDLRRGRRRHSGTLQLPPLSWRQAERIRTPDEDLVARPTTLPFVAPPRIDITPAGPDR